MSKHRARQPAAVLSGRTSGAAEPGSRAAQPSCVHLHKEPSPEGLSSAQPSRCGPSEHQGGALAPHGGSCWAGADKTPEDPRGALPPAGDGTQSPRVSEELRGTRPRLGRGAPAFRLTGRVLNAHPWLDLGCSWRASAAILRPEAWPVAQGPDLGWEPGSRQPQCSLPCPSHPSLPMSAIPSIPSMERPVGCGRGAG